uniref:Uncharacterized protein n=1 Tax=Vespula pensylvanica TaxID=30213 RepID=A0A834PCD3_VESPE|nr:hypothetical protein H0235_003900 [Vespula pensylvanica]
MDCYQVPHLDPDSCPRLRSSRLEEKGARVGLYMRESIVESVGPIGETPKESGPRQKRRNCSWYPKRVTDPSSER